MSRNKLQDVVDELGVHFRDAMRLGLIVDDSLKRLVEERRAAGKRGGGAPPAWNKALNRAAIVATVGAWEAYMERLAEVSLNSMDQMPPSKEWVKISGSRGDIQTPNPRNIRKLFWMLFRFDLQPHWDVQVQVSDADLGGDGTWRVGYHRHSGVDASGFLDAMVRVRHGFAHQDPGQVRSTPGMAITGTTGNVTVQSHHAHNAISGAMQLAVQSTTAVISELALPGMSPWWPKSFNSVDNTGVGPEYWLAGSPAEAAIREAWRGHYPAVLAATAGEAPISRLEAVEAEIPHFVNLSESLNVSDQDGQ